MKTKNLHSSNVQVHLALLLLMGLLTNYNVIAQSIQTERKNTAERIDTTNLDIRIFSEEIVANVSSNQDKAKVLLSWLSNRLEWMGTDYKQRTVNQILARGGGNCFELAAVYMSMMKALRIEYRPVAELNLHRASDERQKNAVEKVKEIGNRASVFGRQHNDHRWVEVHDDTTGEWIPVDPSMNVIGLHQWLKARVWFGKRVTIDTAITNDMIVPFEIYVVSKTNKLKMETSRTRHYLIDGFNNLYGGKLSKLPSWNHWSASIIFLDEIGMKAFAGEVNLHDYSSQVNELNKIYVLLKEEYLKEYGRSTL